MENGVFMLYKDEEKIDCGVVGVGEFYRDLALVL
jgi:aminoglycoside phosphotransferase